MALVHIVHCIDTEGPLTESIKDTFKRIKDTIGVEISSTKENLKKYKRKK